jgi:cytoskeletal protein RodZ
MKAGSVTVGETLSNARRTRALSVDDVAADTRIRATLIRGIESDDFRLCGGNVYARGHIRSIARVVGIDAEPLIAEFDQAHDVDRQVPVVSAVSAQPTDHDLVSRAERRRPNWTAAMATALGVICIVALGGLIAHHSGGNGQPQAKSPLITTPKTSTPPSTPPSLAPTPPVQQTADRATMLVRTVHGTTWLSITSKTGTLLFEGTLAPGEEKKFTNRHGLTFVIGNAPAVDVVVNGHDIGSPPSSGNVSRGDVSPGSDTVQQA